jgi:hypothetical protein
MTTIQINADQLPTSALTDSVLTWNCDEYIIAYDRRLRLLTVEEFEGFDDETGEEFTTVITSASAISEILDQYKPGWPSAAGFTLLADFYGDRWTIATEPR